MLNQPIDMIVLIISAMSLASLLWIIIKKDIIFQFIKLESSFIQTGFSQLTNHQSSHSLIKITKTPWMHHIFQEEQTKCKIIFLLMQILIIISQVRTQEWSGQPIAVHRTIGEHSSQILIMLCLKMEVRLQGLATQEPFQHWILKLDKINSREEDKAHFMRIQLLTVKVWKLDKLITSNKNYMNLKNDPLIWLGDKLALKIVWL